MVAAGIAEAALLLAQHAFEQPHAVKQFQSTRVQDRREEDTRRFGLIGAHLAQT